MSTLLCKPKQNPKDQDKLKLNRQPSSWPSRFRLIILGGNRQGLQVDRDKAVGYFPKLTARKFTTACNSPALGRPGTRLLNRYVLQIFERFIL
jgi:hypothetical protein